jgi:large subunit ribosomal protein L13
MKTFVPKDPGVDRKWVVIDADGLPLGRLGVKIANILRGKDKPIFSHHVDTGDFVVVVNAEKVKLSGNKDEQKKYVRYTGYRGGLRETPVATVRERHPERIIKAAVKGMLPKNNLSRQMYSRLKVYAGESHPHVAQNPSVITL